MQNYASLQETHDHDEEGGHVLFHAEPTQSKWNHINDLDSFFSRMYKYHQRNGIVCMIIEEIFEFNQFGVVVLLTTFLCHGVNYPVLFKYEQPPGKNSKIGIPDVLYSFDTFISNFTFWTWFFLFVAGIVWLLKFLRAIYQIINFWDIKQFYNKALHIADSDLENVTWHEIQRRIIAAQIEHQMCIHKQELTELDIYHRILRKQNYMVALTNKKLIPPKFNVPLLGEVVFWTQSLKYNIMWLFFWSPWSSFENSWQLKEEYKKANLRHELADQLRRQILYVIAANIILSPLIFIWHLLYAFFYYAEILRKEPGSMGVRTWSLYGRQYLRHYNELDHELNARLARAHKPAVKYLEQFNSPVTTLIAQHVGFITGSLLAALIALTVYDEDVITVEHVLSLITVLGIVVTICRAMIPDESVPFCPEALLSNVIKHIHYMPKGWQNKAHTVQVRTTFQQLFQYRSSRVVEELLSPILIPIVLYRYIYPRALDIVDFFRNFTVNIVGVGDVCSFAQMNIKKHGNPDWLPDTTDMAPQQIDQGEEGKVELSLMHFTTTNPLWVPPFESRDFVSFVQEQSSDLNNFDFTYNDVHTNFFDHSDNLGDLPHDNYASVLPSGPRSFVRSYLSEGPNATTVKNMSMSVMYLQSQANRKRGEEEVGRKESAASLKETTPLLPNR